MANYRVSGPSGVLSHLGVFDSYDAAIAAALEVSSNAADGIFVERYDGHMTSTDSAWVRYEHPNPCLRNLTPHAIRVRWGSESKEASPTEFDRVFPVEDSGPARIAATTKQSRDCLPDGSGYGGPGHQLWCVELAWGDPVGLPDPKPGVEFIVSLPMLQAMAGRRSDLVAPDTGPDSGCVRDSQGQVYAVRRFVRMGE